MLISLTSCTWTGYSPPEKELNAKKCALKYPKHEKKYCPDSWDGFREIK
jgi:hypothetical protein